MYLLFEEPSAYSEKNSSVQPVDGGGEEAQLEVCIPMSVHVFSGYTSHSAAPVDQSVEPASIVDILTKVKSLVDPVPTGQL